MESCFGLFLFSCIFFAFAGLCVLAINFEVPRQFEEAFIEVCSFCFLFFTLAGVLLFCMSFAIMFADGLNAFMSVMFG